MKRTIFLAITLVCAVFVAAVNLAVAAPISTPDFVKKVSIANKFEIDSSKLALEKSVNPNVKTFAQQMIDDHMKAGSALKTALSTTKTDAKIEDDLDSTHQDLIDKLKASSSETFDAQYIAMQTDAHKEAVSLFSGYAMNGDDASVKKFAEQTLPTLKSHLEHVQKLKANNGA
ncbi:MAG TPA: DUF4142 domain-containing protein [Pyrinomonadaceae bacterium]|jgi:putative membrane protein|nr:DUF4142 domain-containing protein [Pyrinomonadaceae bacterium]